jgi:predicted transcriptional regulator YdeE
MDSENVTIEEFSVVGISVRTSNKNGQSKKDISALWSQFMSENMVAKIPDKVNENIYCIYTDYESDFMGPYTTILGYEVSSIGNLPEGLIAKTIPVCIYRPFISIGKLPDSVLKTWKYIWESGIKRKYLADFDIYPPDAFSAGNPVVETYLSV